MALVEFVCPAILPIPFSLYFDFFDGFIQAYIFCLFDVHVHERNNGMIAAAGSAVTFI